MLIPLYARARDAARARPALGPGRSAEIRDAIDYDWRRFDRDLLVWALVTRSAWLDSWVRDFLCENPHGTVVDIGAGLNDRFHRLDNGTVRWIDVDLPEAVALRRKFFTDTARCRTLAGSLLEPEWVREVTRRPGPCCLVAEGVLPYLPPSRAREALTVLAAAVPRAWLLCDTTDAAIISMMRLARYHRVIGAEMTWHCEDPATLEEWGTGWRLATSRPLAPIPPWMEVPAWFRIAAGAAVRLAPRRFAGYRLNRFTAG